METLGVYYKGYNTNDIHDYITARIAIDNDNIQYH